MSAAPCSASDGPPATDEPITKRAMSRTVSLALMVNLPRYRCYWGRYCAWRFSLSDPTAGAVRPAVHLTYCHDTYSKHEKDSETPMTSSGQQAPATSTSDDQLVCEVYRSVGDAFAETTSLNIGACRKLSLVPHPGRTLRSAMSRRCADPESFSSKYPGASSASNLEGVKWLTIRTGSEYAYREMAILASNQPMRSNFSQKSISGTPSIIFATISAKSGLK